jgi:hypothetical protein
MDGDVEIRCPAPLKSAKTGKCGSFLGKTNDLGLILKCGDRRCKGFVAVNKRKGVWIYAHITNPETIKALREKLKKKES